MDATLEFEYKETILHKSTERYSQYNNSLQDIHLIHDKHYIVTRILMFSYDTRKLVL